MPNPVLNILHMTSHLTPNKQLREGKYGYLYLVDMGSKPRALNTLGAPYMRSHLRMSGLSPVVMWKGKDDFQPGEWK